MNCPRLPTEDLVAWIDGEAGADAARVAAHAAGCDLCRREAAEFRASAALLEHLPGHAPGPGFAAAVVAAARTAPAGRLRRLRPRIAAAAAAVLVVAGGAAWWLGRGTDADADLLTAREAEALADDLEVIANLDALQAADEDEIAALVEDLDVLDGLGAEPDGG